MPWASRWTSSRVTCSPPTLATTPAEGDPTPRSVPRPPGIRVITMAPQKTRRIPLSTIFLIGPGVCKKRIIFLSLQKLGAETKIINYRAVRRTSCDTQQSLVLLPAISAHSAVKSYLIELLKRIIYQKAGDG